MKVKTRDFQILKGEHEFEFPVGITVIQGKTGSGKTTLFYAIEDCLTNPAGVDDTIHWDAKDCSVTLENNDAKITWIKTQTSSEYKNELTGQDFVKASKLDSRNLGDLGFYFDKSNDVVNIHSEWKKLFPFEMKDTEMFRLFEDIFNISCSFVIIDDYKKDEQQVKSVINNTTAQINDLTQKQATINDILSKISVEHVKTHIDRLNNSQYKLTELQKDYNIILNNQKYEQMIIPNEYNSTELINKNNYCVSLKQDYANYLHHKQLENIKLPEIKQFNIKENPYGNDYSNYLSLLQSIQAYENEIVKINVQEQQVKEKLKEIKVCPTCGHKLEN